MVAEGIERATPASCAGLGDHHKALKQGGITLMLDRLGEPKVKASSCRKAATLMRPLFKHQGHHHGLFSETMMKD
jgi:hypothetical protein